jgi:hypothetical protein
MPAGELPTSVLELRARHSIPNDGTPRPKSTVGLVLDHVKVVMVVPGGPVDRLPERADGLRIEHLDTVLAIDPDGNSGLKPVTSSNVISLLRGDDTVGSLVKLLIKKSTEKLPIEFMLTRADYREVFLSPLPPRYCAFVLFHTGLCQCDSSRAEASNDSHSLHLFAVRSTR